MTAYHWRHGYIPLDARTAQLWGKKQHAESLIRAGRIHTPEPESWHSLFGKDHAEESPSASKTNLAVKELPFLGAVNHAAKRKVDLIGQRKAARDYVEALRLHSSENGKRFPHRSETNVTKAEIGVTRALHAAIAAGVPGLLHPDAREPHRTGKVNGPVTVRGIEDFREIAKWHAGHEANLAHLRGLYEAPEKKSRGTRSSTSDLVSLRAHLNKGLPKGLPKGSSTSPAAPPKPKAPKAPDRSELEKVFSPKEGDTLTPTDVTRGGDANLNQQYVFKNGVWRLRLRANTDGRFALAGPQHNLDIHTVRLHAMTGMIHGVDMGEAVKQHEKTRTEEGRHNLARAQEAINGLHDVHGFEPVSFMDPRIDIPVDDSGLHFIHPETGTTFHLHDGVQYTPQQIADFAKNVDFTTKTTGHLIGEHNGGAVHYHVDKHYVGGRSWGNTGAYVITSAAEGKNQVHVNPELLTSVKATTSKALGTNMGWSMPSIHEGPSDTAYSLVHENGHIFHNRSGHFSFLDQRGSSGRRLNQATIDHFTGLLGPHIADKSLIAFHKATWAGVPGGHAQYARTNNAEGYAEAWTHFHLGKLGANHPEDHGITAAAQKYADRFGWTKAAAGAVKEVKTA